ncbi:MAG: transcriptional regulator, winged helix family [Microvirga sp.]|jgi:predicted ATPase/DNA-binding winged helix-turn-helix (wHTH) protein|nr:transcriptional regulator, winged helix family [Microvirga sp.]
MSEMLEESGARGAACFGPYVLNPARRQLLREGVTVPLGTRAMDLLIALVENAGHVLTHRQLIERAWQGLTVEDANLRVHISHLRKSLGDDGGGGSFIENLVGRGYSFVAPVRWTKAAIAIPQVTASSLPPPQPRQRQRLALPPARIVGLDGLVQDLTEQLERSRFVTIAGAGGIGKTTVATLIGKHIQGEGGEVIFLDLSPIRDPQLLSSALASTLGLVAKPDLTEDAIIAHLQGSKALLILDSCEHVIDAVASLCERLFAELDELHILATSRETLRVSGEHVHLLKPLGTPPGGGILTAAEAMAYPAVQLFMERAATSGYRASLEDGQAEVIAEVCRRLDGVALAIELVASRTGAFGLQGVADMLGEGFQLHGYGRRGAPPRHQTLEALFDWSYALLSPRDQKVLQRLATFTGFFTLKDALAVASDGEEDRLPVASAVTGLVDKSLIWTSAGGSPVYFRLLDTTRAFASRKLEESGERDRIARRHLQHLLHVLTADELDKAIFSGRDLSAHTPRLGDVRAALEWARGSTGNPTDFVHLCAVAAPLFLGLSLLPECEHWCRLGLSILGDENESRHARLLLLEGLAIGAMFTQGNRDTISSAIRSGQALAGSLNEVGHELHLLAGEHIFETRLGDFARALHVAERCMDVCSRVDTPDALAMANWMMGCAHHLLGDQMKAQQFTERGFEYYAAGDAQGVDYFGFDHKVRAIAVRARAAWLRGDLPRSAQLAEDLVTEADRRGHPVSICIALVYATTVAVWSEEADLADRRIRRLLQHASRHTLTPYRVVGEGLMGQLAVHHGEAAQGVAALERSLTYCRNERHQVLATEMMASLARGRAALGHFDAARATVTDAIEQATLAGGACNLTDLFLAQAEIEIVGGGTLETIDRLLRRALQVSRQQSAHHLELRAAILNDALHGRRDTAALVAECRERVSDDCGGHYATVAREILSNRARPSAI